MPLKNTLKHLLIRKVFMYPRFQVEIANELESGTTVKVIELRQPLTKKMRMIQSGLMECLSMCVMDLKRSKLLVIPLIFYCHLFNFIS